jgi:hypothetical protein
MVPPDMKTVYGDEDWVGLAVLSVVVKTGPSAVLATLDVEEFIVFFLNMCNLWQSLLMPLCNILGF